MKCSINIQLSLVAVKLSGICLATIWLGGCAMLESSGTKKEVPPRQLGGAKAGERITRAELDELTRAFADRYVGLLYSVCGALKENNPDPVQRRAAQTLLIDNANNAFDIASNADPFTRVLDLLVVTTLVSQEWDADGRAEAVFGNRGQPLAEALSQTRAEAHLLAARVLSAEQLKILDSLLRDWREKNPKVTRASFVRFSNFAIGRGRSAATQVLQARGLFSEIEGAGQSVDEARMFAERTLYRLKRESTLLRWQAIAIKDDWAATPEINTALTTLHSVSEQIEQLPANIAAEREAILTGLDERLQHADGTIAKVRGVLDEADTLAETLKPVSDSINEMLTTADTLFARYAALEQSKTGNEGRRFDIREYGQTAKELTLAAERITELLTKYEQLLGSSDSRQGLQKLATSVDGRIMTVSNQSEVVMNAFFWRACVLLAVLFTMLLAYRALSLLLQRKLAVDSHR